jgi:uncharacterized protein YdaU (DUF1376 family)
MKHYPHHIGDFNGATRHLTRIERSVYRDLLDLYYDTEQPLNTDVALLCRRILANSNEESTAVKQVLKEFFTSAKLGWYHDRCEAVIYSYHQNTSQKALAGKASAEAKRLRKQQAMAGTNGQQLLTKDKTATSVAPPDGVSQSVWDEFVAHRKRKKETVSKLVVAGIQKEADKAGWTLEDALSETVIRGWKSFKAIWVAKKSSSQAQTLSFAERDQLAKQKRWEEMTGRQWPTESQSFIDVDTSVLELK